jgi:outer membrane protein insertion porin family
MGRKLDIVLNANRLWGLAGSMALGTALLSAPALAAPAKPASKAPAAQTGKPAAKPAAKPAPAKPAPAKPAPTPAPAGSDTYGPPAMPTDLPPKPAPTVAPKPADNEAKTLVADIQIRGNQRISDERILLSIPITMGDRAGRSDILDAIQRIYGMGYFQDVKAGSEPMLGGERLIFTVVENPLMGDVVFQGVTKVETAKLEALFQPLKGDILNYNAIKETVDKVQKLYTDAGYPLARVADMNVAPGGILQLRIAEGKIHSIKFSGNEETKDYVLRREISSTPGEIFSSEKIKADLRRIYNLNYFEELNLKFEPAPTPEEVIVVIEVKEKQTGSINLGAGYSTQQGILGMLSVKKDNLFGSGQQVGVDFSVSQRLQVSGELTYFNPWFDENRTGLGGSVYLRRFNNFLADFREDRMGASVNASRPLFGDALGSPWRGSVGIRAENISTYENFLVGGNPKPVYPEGSPNAGQRITLSPGGTDTVMAGSLGVTFDTRDVIMSPTEGWFSNFTLEPGVVNFNSPLVRGTASVNHFVPLFAMPWAPTERSTLAIGTRLGLIAGPQVPFYERFYSTGPFLVRGWPEFVSLGSLQAQNLPANYFQGSNAAVASLEYRFPIFNVVSGVVFGDTGMFWDNSLTDANGRSLLHSGYGAGLRLNTPLGPIRLDYGLREFDLAKGQFHFSIGQKF